MKKIIFIILLFILLACQHKDKQDDNNFAEFVTDHKTQVKEPSGLALSHDKKFLWTVSDNTGSLYKISFSGEVIDEIKKVGKDPEGVAVIDDSTLAVVLERERLLIILDTKGNELKRKEYNELSDEKNSGPEGLSYNPTTGGFFMVNEKKSTSLIETDKELNIIMNKKLNIASDLSGICYEPVNKNLWIVSDEDKLIAQCDLEGNIINSFRANVPQMEGIAVDYDEKKIYVISDVTGKLFIYKMVN